MRAAMLLIQSPSLNPCPDAGLTMVGGGSYATFDLIQGQPERGVVQ